jgi:hypothetical protein
MRATESIRLQEVRTTQQTRAIESIFLQEVQIAQQTRATKSTRLQGGSNADAMTGDE